MTSGTPLKVLQPQGWTQPKGYANGMAGRGTTIIVGGQIGWNGQQQFETDDFVAQCRQALLNIVAILREGRAGPEHIARMTWYVVDKREYIASYRELGVVYREILGRNFPAMTAVQVVALIEDRAKVEIEVTAILPDA